MDIPEQRIKIAVQKTGSQQHFAQVFASAEVDGALAASVFHSGDIDIMDLKKFLTNSDIEVRM